MTAAPSSPSSVDPRFPHLAPEVVAGYLEAPDTVIAEVIDGVLSLMPRPRPRHARAASVLNGDLHGPFDRGRDGPGGWVLLPEPELHLGPMPDIVVTDLAGWRRPRVPVDFLADEAPAHLTLVPDWVCAVISDRTEAHDRGKKRRIYRREGVKHYWIVDPRVQTLEVFRLEDGRWVEVDTWEGDALVRAEPFDAIALDLSGLWKL